MPALFLLPQNILLSAFSYFLFYLFGSNFAKLISVAPTPNRIGAAAILQHCSGINIFQRGNPIPYLAAAMQINEDRPYVQVAVNDNAGIYISHRGECPALFNYIEDTWNATFREQMGGTYFFVTDADTLMVSAEIYWAKFTVWTIPNVTLAGG